MLWIFGRWLIADVGELWPKGWINCAGFYNRGYSCRELHFIRMRIRPSCWRSTLKSLSAVRSESNLQAKRGTALTGLESGNLAIWPNSLRQHWHVIVGMLRTESNRDNCNLLCNVGTVLKSTHHEMMLVTQHWPDKSSYIVCIQNLPTNCSRKDIINLLSSMFALYLQRYLFFKFLIIIIIIIRDTISLP